MLKIKDNVDLKELEKFGFYKENESDDWYFYEFLGDSFPACEPLYWCGVLEKNEEEYDAIERVLYSFQNDIPNVVYDLIQSELVEKASD